MFPIKYFSKISYRGTFLSSNLFSQQIPTHINRTKSCLFTVLIYVNSIMSFIVVHLRKHPHGSIFLETPGSFYHAVGNQFCVTKLSIYHINLSNFLYFPSYVSNYEHPSQNIRNSWRTMLVTIFDQGWFHPRLMCRFSGHFNFLMLPNEMLFLMFLNPSI